MKGKTALTKDVAHKLSLEYQSLTEEELSRYQTAGAIATYAHKKGMPSFTNEPLNHALPRHEPVFLNVGDETSSGAIVLADAPRFLVPYTGDSLSERYVTMKASMTKLHDELSLTQEEQDRYNQFRCNTQESSVVASVEQTGFESMAQGFSQQAFSTTLIKGVHWQPPISGIVQAPLLLISDGKGHGPWVGLCLCLRIYLLLKFTKLL